MNPKMPIDWSLTFIWGYLQREEPEVQLQIIVSVLARFLLEYVPKEDHHEALRQIEESIPLWRLVNAPTEGGMQ